MSPKKKRSGRGGRLAKRAFASAGKEISSWIPNEVKKAVDQAQLKLLQAVICPDKATLQDMFKTFAVQYWRKMTEGGGMTKREAKNFVEINFIDIYFCMDKGKAGRGNRDQYVKAAFAMLAAYQSKAMERIKVANEGRARSNAVSKKGKNLYDSIFTEEDDIKLKLKF